MTLLTPLGEKIRASRCALGWSQLELAVKADLSERTVRAAEKSQKVSAKALSAIANALQVILEELAPKQKELTEFLRSSRNMAAFLQGIHRAMTQQDPGILIERMNKELRINYAGRLEGVETIQTLMGQYDGLGGVQRFVENVARFWALDPGSTFTVDVPFTSGNTVVLCGNHLLNTVEGKTVWGRYSYLVDFDGERLQNINAVMAPLHPAVFSKTVK